MEHKTVDLSQLTSEQVQLILRIVAEFKRMNALKEK